MAMMCGCGEREREPFFFERGKSQNLGALFTFPLFFFNAARVGDVARSFCVDLLSRALSSHGRHGSVAAAGARGKEGQHRDAGREESGYR